MSRQFCSGCHGNGRNSSGSFYSGWQRKRGQVESSRQSYGTADPVSVFQSISLLLSLIAHIHSLHLAIRRNVGTGPKRRASLISTRNRRIRKPEVLEIDPRQDLRRVRIIRVIRRKLSAGVARYRKLRPVQVHAAQPGLLCRHHSRRDRRLRDTVIRVAGVHVETSAVW